MSAGSASGIGPVSVRYAAQIRELLYSQAMQRLQAERERARAAAEAEKLERMQPKKTDDVKPVNLKVDAPVESKTADAAPAAAASTPAQAPAADDSSVTASTTAQLVDVQA